VKYDVKYSGSISDVHNKNSDKIEKK